MEHLLQVENTFLIKGRGVIITPPLPLPTVGTFRPFRDTVQLRCPDGTVRDVVASFELEHLKLVAGGSQTDIAIILQAATKDEIPVGTLVFVHASTRKRLRGTTDNAAV